MYGTGYVTAETPIEAKLLPQIEPSETNDPPLLLGVLTRWKLVKKNGAIALSTLLGHKEIH